MSYYYKYNFVSPEPLYAIVKEELKSYFDTGMIDDLLFPVYLHKCLEKLGRGSYVITETVLYIEDFEARLPDNFYAAREAWFCTESKGTSYQSPNSFYAQASSSTTIQIAPMTVNGESCENPECVDGCDNCMPKIAQAVYKTNTERMVLYVKNYLLKPGTISAKSSCDVDYISNWNQQDHNNTSAEKGTKYGSSYDSFDIRGNKFVTNFRNGVVNLMFYATDYDEIGNQLIPDNYRIKEFVEAFIKYKMFEALINQITDETFNQIKEKLGFYKQLSEEAFIIASTEIKKQTMWESQRDIKRQKTRLRRYELPSGGRKYIRRY